MAKLLKKALSERAVENTTVTKGTSKNQQTVKAGVPNDHSRKHEVEKSESDKAPVVGVSIGITKNMENYESLRVDCWLTDTVNEGETVEQAYNRVVAIVDKTLQDTVSSYL